MNENFGRTDDALNVIMDFFKRTSPYNMSFYVLKSDSDDAYDYDIL
jgi:hypothetical protein